jgi:hypothetical protein
MQKNSSETSSRLVPSGAMSDAISAAADTIDPTMPMEYSSISATRFREFQA